MKKRIDELEARLTALIESAPVSIAAILAGNDASAAVPGVYLLSAPDKPAAIVYAGRTKSKTIHGRLCDHCQLKTHSDLAGMLKRFPRFPQAPRDYEARWIEIVDPIERAQLELFAIAVLRPLFNRYV